MHRSKSSLRQERETVSTLKEELKVSPEEVQLVELGYDGAGSEIRVLSENQLGKWSRNSLSLAHHVLGHDY